MPLEDIVNRQERRAYRGPIFHMLSAEEPVFLQDGGLIVNEKGGIEACDHWQALEREGKTAGLKVITLASHDLIIPGFVDTHVHLPQLPVTGCQEENLLSWLEKCIFPAEAKMSNTEYAWTITRWFFEQLLKNGTTTANVFLTSHQLASNIAFEIAQKQGNRVIMGQNMMDANAPQDLLKPINQLVDNAALLYHEWHGADKGRILYAFSPRFALTSSEALLEAIGKLRERFPEAYLHTHISEQPGEVEAVRSQFPWAKDYTEVYERYGLLRERTVLAHGVHLGNDELDRIQQHNCSLAHCPSSNFFLKSGRFRLTEVIERRIRFGLGSDVGAGPELNMFKVMKDAQYMQQDALVSFNTLFHAATLGGAEALFLEDRIGNFLPGKEADFVVLDFSAREDFVPPGKGIVASEPLLARLMYVGDDRLVKETFIRGKSVYRKELSNPSKQRHSLADLPVP